MAYIRLLLSEYRILGYGISLTFFSSFGQTFLISLYVPSILDTFSLSNSAFGIVYSLATISSAFLLLYFGRMIDHKNLLHYSLAIVIGMVISCFVLGFAQSVFLVFIGIFGLRLFGQGLMTHSSLTTMARYFRANRGQAVSLAGLGHHLGEFFFPFIIVSLIVLTGWRETLFISGIFVLIVLAPLIYFFIKKYDNELLTGYSKNKKEVDISAGWKYSKILKDKRSWIILPNIFIVGCFITALFFYQLLLASEKAWTPQWMAICVGGFAISSSVSALVTGPWIDRISAKLMFPYHVFPLFLALFLLYLGNEPLLGMIFMILLGITVGSGGSMKSALWAELYGTESLGTIRSFYTTAMVLSTAMGPPLFGFLLDMGASFDDILLFSAIITIFVLILTVIFSRCLLNNK